MSEFKQNNYPMQLFYSFKPNSTIKACDVRQPKISHSIRYKFYISSSYVKTGKLTWHATMEIKTGLNHMKYNVKRLDKLTVYHKMVRTSFN